MTLYFTIEGRPTAWQRHIEFVDRRTHRIVKKTPPDMKAQQDAIRWIAMAALRKQRHGEMLTGPLKLELLAVYAIPPSWHPAKQAAARAGIMWKTSVADLDNLTKQVCDALNGYAYADDAQIAKMSCAKRFGTPERTEVRLSVLDDGLCDRMDKRAFEEWALANGQQAVVKARGAWVMERLGQQTLDLPLDEACNMVTPPPTEEPG